MGSLGAMTGTRVDSATKHVRTCRVNEDLIRRIRDKSFGTYTAENSEVSTYMVLKDDLFIACKPCICTGNANNMNKAYTVGISSLTNLSAWGRLFIIMRTMYCDTEEETKDMIEQLNSAAKTYTDYKHEVTWVPDFFCFGVALTDGYPSGNFGDTALSVQTGGMSTVSNGPFYVNCGDILTWVWDFEIPFISEDKGKLCVRNQVTIEALDKPTNRKEAKEHSDEDYTEMLNVAFCKMQLTEDHDFKDSVDIILKREKIISSEKSLHASKFSTSYLGVQSRSERIGYSPRIIRLPHNATYTLKKRCFGKAMGFARAWESLDIMISRQGL